jgi:hypothetical protein
MQVGTAILSPNACFRFLVFLRFHVSLFSLRLYHKAVGNSSGGEHS